MPKAVALYSGGLDSTLAILLLKRQGIDVTAVTFLTHFGCDMSDRSSCSKDPFSAAVKFGFDVKLSHLSVKFIEIVKNPKFGHGSNMNPCIDCRILMLREAKELMGILNADFIITGEVLGQRPMSQRKNTLPLIDKEAGVKGYVLRPLSAKLLKPTVPEETGIVDRDMLCALSGRSRKPQIALAREFGLHDYPNPAGGCLLTEPIFSYRLKDLLMHVPDADDNDLNLLRSGRHFRLSPFARFVVGRDERENEAIAGLKRKGDCMMWVEGAGSPVALLRGVASEEDLRISASICARYSDAKALKTIAVHIESYDGEKTVVSVESIDEPMLDAIRIEEKKDRPERRKKDLIVST
jgi:hypothetical protein